MTSPAVTRRQFTLALAGGTTLAASPSASVGQQISQNDTESKPPPADKSTGKSEKASPETPAPGEPREPPPEAAYLLGLVMRRYADDRLDETAVSGIVRDIYGDLARSRVLSRFPLDNADEPGFTFQAWRAD